jgi:ribonuclease E
MLDNEPTGGPEAGVTPASETADNAAPRRTRARSSRSRAAAAPEEAASTSGASAPESGAPSADAGATPAAESGAEQAAAPAKRRRRRTGAEPAAEEAAVEGGEPAATPAETEKPATTRRSRRRSAASAAEQPAAEQAAADQSTADQPAADQPAAERPAAAGPERAEAPATRGASPFGGEGEQQPASGRRRAPVTAPVLFMAPEVPQPQERASEAPARSAAPAKEAAAEEPASRESGEAGELGESGRSSRRRRGRRGAAEQAEQAEHAEHAEEAAEAAEPEEPELDDEAEDDEEGGASGRRRRRRGRRGRGRGKGPGEDGEESDEDEAHADEAEAADEEEAGEGGEPLTRRRRRRRRGGSGGEAGESTEDGVLTVVRVRPPRAGRDEVQGVSGSTRLEAKRQRRRDGRDQRRTRPPILSESEFLARREAVDRVMVVREKGDRTQIAVLEDGVLVEHYVTRASSGTMVGNVYLGKVQNVLPSMEAAFIDIGRGRNGVLYAGEVNWDAAGLEGRARSIEQALKSGDSVLVQVTKDPIGHKGARLTSHIALSGRHLVYVPGGNTSGISRKLPDTERKRLRDVLKHLVPETAGVIVRTAAEGAAEDELERDVTRLQATWDEIERKSGQGGAPVLLYEEPDLVIRVVRDLFNEDFRELVVQGNGAYEMVEGYLQHVSPDLVERLHRHTGTTDLFAARRIDEQILKGLDRKVYLPSGGSLVIDRTEAMTVIDVNTGKYTGTGGNLEETVTRNNLEAAEEIVRQLRLRDLGGIVVIDFIDMVLESNRELVLRRLTECLGRDRTKHQVTEITSLGLVQMTRKRIGLGLLEAFSETCEHCKGRGVIIHTEPVPERKPAAKAVAEVASAGSGSRRRDGRKRDAAEPEAAEPQEEPLEGLDSGEDSEVPVPVGASVSDDGLGVGEPASELDVADGPAAPAPAKRRTLWSSRRRSR